MIVPIIFAVLLQTTDSARVYKGRLLVEPVGISFVIPPAFMDTAVGYLAWYPQCKRNSPSARRINTERTALLDLTRETGFWNDHHYIAIANAIFEPHALVVQMGQGYWRECDNTADLQMRVYVSDMTHDSIARRVRDVRVAPSSGYSPPIPAAPRDSAGWRVETLNWVFNCGDCSYKEQFEIWSRHVAGRTVSIVFMSGPSGKTPPSPELLIRRSILQSFLTRTANLPPLPGLDSIIVVTPSCNDSNCEWYHLRFGSDGEASLAYRKGEGAKFVETNAFPPAEFDFVSRLAKAYDLQSLPNAADRTYCPGRIKPGIALTYLFFGPSGLEKQIQDNRRCNPPAKALKNGVLSSYDRLMQLRHFEDVFSAATDLDEWIRQMRVKQDAGRR